MTVELNKRREIQISSNSFMAENGDKTRFHNSDGGIEVIIAFIMAKVESTKSRAILDEVRSLEEVEEAYLIYGAYDLLIKCVFKTPEALSSFVVNELRKVDGVKDTITNVCATCE